MAHCFVEGTPIERVVPDAKLHLEEQIILCELVLTHGLSDHLQRVVAILVDASLPALNVQS